MDDEHRLLEMRTLAMKYLDESANLIRQIAPKTLLTEVENWLPKRRLIDPAIFISRAICDLESKVFGKRELYLTAIAGSAMALSDDIIDSQSEITYDKVKLLENHESNYENGLLGLFKAFNYKLIRILPPDFRWEFEEIIKHYNLAQEESMKLFSPTISREEIASIKDRAGGYSVLLLHAMMYPEEKSITKTPIYLDTPSSKQEALYSYGAWLSRVDDLWDLEKDKSKGMKQLATEGIITWDSLPFETQKMKNCLRHFFPINTVNKFVEKHYSPLINYNLFIKSTQKNGDK